MQTQVDALSATWSARQRDGFVREGHGDLHLANLVCLDGDGDEGEVTAFDAIEFDPALRWIDIVADIAFAVMDLQARGRADLAWRLLDGWLAVTGDHAGLAVLRPYLVYRALVRAMVGGLRPGDAAADYVGAAAHWRDGADARLLITEGLPGSGKSRLALALLQACGAVRLRSDVERKRLHGLGALQSTASPVGAGAYDAEATQRTYARLLGAAEVALRAGWRVVVDAAFLRAGQRAAFEQLAAGLRVPFHVLCCDAPDTVLLQRLQQRADAGADASEADARVLAWLRTQRQPLAPHEQAHALHAGPGADVHALARAWLRG
jgi:predicted kinase